MAGTARRADRDKATIRRWIKDGKLKASRIGREWLIDERDLERDLERACEAVGAAS